MDASELRWHRHFLDLCIAHAKMSKDPSTRVGAVIVGPDRELRQAGFNGFPRRIRDTPKRLNDRDTKNLLVVHAEMNALLQCARVGIPTNGCTLYLVATDVPSSTIWGGAPCTRCTVSVIQAGIAEVVTYPFKKVPSRWADDVAHARARLREARIRYVEIPQEGRGK